MLPAAPSTDPVFVVGLPRSGTTLMAVCLDRHPAIHCGPETHLFHRLAGDEGRVALDPAHWPDAAVDLVLRIATEGDADPAPARPDPPRPDPARPGPARPDPARPDPTPPDPPRPDPAPPDPAPPDPAPPDPARVRAFLAARAPSAAAIMEALVALPAVDAGKRRWAEKTPRHLDHLRAIRAAWPDAAVIRMVRDPRSRAVSMSRVPFGPESQVANLLDGLRRDRRAQVAVDIDPRLLTVRLEDLQADPETTLRRVCEFLGEAYDPAMLVASEHALAVPTAEWWKRSATGPVSSAGSSTWQEAMPDAVQRFASLYCAGQLERHGYPGARSARSAVVVVPSDAHFVRRHETVALALARRDTVLRGIGHVTWRRLRRTRHLVYWGARGRLVPRVAGRPAGWPSILVLTLDLGVRRLRRRPAGWVEDDASGGPTPASGGAVERVSPVPRERWLGAAVWLLARRTTPDTVAATGGLGQPSAR